MFNKISILFLTLFVGLLMSCDNEALSAEEEAGAEVAIEVAGQALEFAGMALTGGAGGAHTGLSRASSDIITFDLDNEVEGLSGTGTYTYSISDFATFTYNINLSMTYTDVKSEDGVWTMNGNLVSTLDMEYAADPLTMNIEGTVTGTLNVSDGENEYSFIFDLTQTQEMNAEGSYSCTVSGTITSGTSVININETFTYTS